MDSGSIYNSKAEGNVVVARISPLKQTTRFSNTIPLMFRFLWTGDPGMTVGGMEVTLGCEGLDKEAEAAVILGRSRMLRIVLRRIDVERG